VPSNWREQLSETRDNNDSLVRLDAKAVNLGSIAKLIDDFKTKTNELGFTSQRAIERSYNMNIEEELNEAYSATRILEKDMKQLVGISEFLVQKTQEFEEKVAEVTQDRDELTSDSGYLQEMYDQVKEREIEKNDKINSLEKEIEQLQLKNIQLKDSNNWLETQVNNIQQENEDKADVIHESESIIQDASDKHM